MSINTSAVGVGAPNRHRIRNVLAAGIAAMLVPLSLGIMPTAANAAGETLNVTLSQTTGTGPFDGDDAAGHDSSATNNIVRTNDTVSYSVGIRYEGGDQTNPKITLTLPQGEALSGGLPAFCLDGSSLTPSSLPDPTVPLTATSWTTLPVQTIECVVAPQAQGTALDYVFLADVRPEVPNGTQLSPVVAQAVSDQVTTPAVSQPVDHIVSAAPNFDLSKRLNATTDTTGPLFSQYVTCTFDQSKTCLWTEYPLTISAPAGAKGISPLATPITFTDDLSPDVFYPAGTTSDPDWIAAGAGAADKYGARIVFCDRGVQNLHGYIPNSHGGTDTNKRAVRNSGTITCTQPGGAGTPVLFSITGADTSGVTYPTQNADGGALPSESALVISTTVLIETPLEAITDLGTRVNDADTLATHNTYSNLGATDIGGQPNVDNPANNVRDTAQQIQVSDGALDKAFVGITGTPGNAPTAGFGGVWEGLPGSSFWRDGNTVAVEGQTVVSILTNTRYGIPPNSGDAYLHTTMICDVWDDTKLGLPQTFNYAGSSTTNMRAPSNGSPVWVASENAGGTIGSDPSVVQNLQFQYSYTPTPGNGTASSCETGNWFSSPAQVPGATLVDGVWQGVNQVRAAYTDRSTNGSFYQLNLAIAMQVVSKDTTGTILPNWASRAESTGVKTLSQVLADTAHRSQTSNYDPASAGGSLGDRLILGEASARISKYVKNSTTGEFTDTTAPQYTAGSTIDYRLNPSLTADVTAGVSADVVVEDCLPAYQVFTSSSRESGAPLSPTTVQQGSPAGAGVTCAAGETYIRWDLGPQTVNSTIDPILYTVEVLATARNGVYTNTAVVSSPADGSPVAARTDTAQVQINVPTGIKIAKSVDKPVVEVTPDGATTPRGFTWTIDFANIDAPQNVSNPDVIDVLPANGVGGTHFTGTLTLASVTPSSTTTGVAILYTADPSAQLQVDPSDPSNGSTGSTVWCDAATGGAVVSGAGSDADCPTSLADVTGLRFQRPGAFTGTDELKINVAMVPSGNSAADVYENRTSGRVVGVSQPVGPAVRAVTVVSSSIGDYVWNDVNGNGIQDAGEPAVPGFPVSLTGTDIDGNVINRTTTTDANGKYLFDGLPSGEYTVTFDPAGLGDTYSFTLPQQGTDATLDSDADQTTGVAPTVTLGQNEQNLDVDAGLIRNQTASIVLTKVVVDPDTSDTAGDATSFPVTVTCTVPENPTPIVINTTVAADGTPTVLSDLPVGATCVIVETDTDGGVVSYSVDAGTVTTIGEPVDVTITNTFPGTSVTKDVVGAPVKNANGSYTITYDVVVTNTGEVATVYTVEDKLHYGGGIVVDGAKITVSPDGVELSDSWNGVSDLVIAEDVAIPVGGVHKYRVEVTATVPTTVTSGARNCEVGNGETGTGFLNTATVSTDLGEASASDCAPVPEEPTTPTKPAASGSLPNTGANVTVGILALLGLLIAGSLAVFISRRRNAN